jgi:hypothetical protein
VTSWSSLQEQAHIKHIHGSWIDKLQCWKTPYFIFRVLKGMFLKQLQEVKSAIIRILCIKTEEQSIYFRLFRIFYKISFLDLECVVLSEVDVGLGRKILPAAEKIQFRDGAVKSGLRGRLAQCFSLRKC